MTISGCLVETAQADYEPPHGKTNNVVSEQVDTNRAVQSQKQARSLKFRI